MKAITYIIQNNKSVRCITCLNFMYLYNNFKCKSCCILIYVENKVRRVFPLAGAFLNQSRHPRLPRP